MSYWVENLLKEEKKLWRKGYKYVVGLDEAGRGPLAGPVVAAAVIINPRPETKNKINSKFKIKNLKLKTGQIQNLKFYSDKSPKTKTQLKAELFTWVKKSEIRDSKKLAPKKREELYQILIHHPQIKWGIGRVSEKTIDKINILEATKLAMIKAIKNLGIKPDFLILDGNFELKLKIKNSKFKNIIQKLKHSRFNKTKSIIKADEKVLSCLLASIIAKVTRDKIMEKHNTKFPQYGFNRHKGYPTKFHLEMLKKYGICKIHRKTFNPAKHFV